MAKTNTTSTVRTLNIEHGVFNNLVELAGNEARADYERANATAILEAAIRKALKGRVSRLDCEPIVMQLYATTYETITGEVQLVAKERGTGETWATDGAAKGAYKRMMRKLCGTTENGNVKAKAETSDHAPAAPATKKEAAAVAMFIEMVGSRKRALELLNAAK